MRLSIDQYDVKALKRYFITILVMVAALKVTMGFAAIAMLIALFGSFARRKMEDVLFWILLLTVTSTGNHIIFSTNFITVTTVRLALILSFFPVFARIFSARRRGGNSVFLGLLVYLLWEAAISGQGYSPVISYLKLGLFTWIYLAYCGIANTVNDAPQVNPRRLRAAILSIVILMIGGSFALIPFPGIASMTPDQEMLARIAAGEGVNLFCGMCSHSQALGPLMGILGTIVFADMVFSVRRGDPLYIALLTMCPLVIYRTSSRTGMGTLLGGICMVGFVLMQSRGLGNRWKGKVLFNFIFLGLLFVTIAILVPSIRGRVAKYALKWGDRAEHREVTVKEMFATRQEKIDIAMYNFRRKPLLGNGFQVSDTMQYERRSGLLSYFSAPIEKGVWIYAVLEEGGVPGLILLSAWMLIVFAVLIHRRYYVMVSTFFALVMANTGEFCMFAMTFTGGFYWAMVFAAGTLDGQRNRLR